MTLKLSTHWVWDFWFARDGADYHLFYLKAPRALGDPELRHWNVCIGHSVSQDLIDWHTLPDAIQPAAQDSDAWDNYTTWTGCVVQHEDLWYLFYTGTCRAEKGLIQRIGLATSPDLIRWEKHPANPLIEADPRWYEQLDRQLWHDQAWRDPWVFQHEGIFHALITGRANDGPRDQRGVIAHARSTDLIRWEVLPPLAQPGAFGQMEVPQLVAIEDGYYLIFSCDAEHVSRGHQERFGARTGTYYLYADSPLGPYRPLSDQLLLGDEAGRFYSGKLVQGPDRQWYLMAFKNLSPNGDFIGELSDPMPVQITRNGRLIAPQTARGTHES